MKPKTWLKILTPAIFWLWVCSCMPTEEPVKPPFEYWSLDKSQMVWGSETNGIKAGVEVVGFTNRPDARQNGIWCVACLLFQTNSTTKLYVGHTNSNSNSFVGITEGTTTMRTNGMTTEAPYWLVMADVHSLTPVERNYQVKLWDADGVEAARTERGETVKHTFIDNPVFEGWRHSRVGLINGQVSPFIVDFHLSDFFKVSKPGKYHLQMQLRIFCRYARGKPYERYEPLILPPIDVEFLLPMQ